MRQDDVPDFVPKFLDLFLKTPDFVSDLALKFPDLVPKLLNLIWKRRMAEHVSSPWLSGLAAPYSLVNHIVKDLVGNDRPLVWLTALGGGG